MGLRFLLATLCRHLALRHGSAVDLWRRPLSLLYKFPKIGVQIASGIDLPCEARMGRRLVIEHFGSIIVSGDTVIGDDVTLRHGATLVL